MRKALITSLSIVTLTSKAFAIGYPLDKDTVLPLAIAKDAPTRITIEGEKISDVFFYPETSLKVTLHPSGNLFLVPEKESKTAQVTVMGESGSVQDLKLTFTKKETSPVILYPQCDGCVTSDNSDVDLTQIKPQEGGESATKGP